MAPLDPLDRRILSLAWPALGALTVEPLYVLVDTGIVGHLGTAPLGGLALASTILNAVVWGSNFLSFATTSRVAYATGAGDHELATRVVRQSLLLAVTIGVTAGAVVSLGGRALAAGLGGNGAVLDAATTYLRISGIGIPFVVVANVVNGQLRGLADTRTPFVVVLGANALNVVLEVVMVYGLDLGVAGSAWGTVVAQVGAAVVFVGISGRRSRAPAAAGGWRPDWPLLRRMLGDGRRIVVRTLALFAALAISTAVATRLGAVTLAAHQIAFQMYLFLALALDALAVPGQTLVAQHLGAGAADEARLVARRVMRLGLSAGGVVAALLLAAAFPLPHVFTADPAVARRAAVALVLAALMQFPAAVAFTGDGILMGAEDYRFLQWNCVVSLLVFAPLAAAVVAWDGLGIGGVWAGLIVWMGVRGGLNWWRVQGTAWLAR